MKIRGYLYGAAASVIWGTVFFLGRIVMNDKSVHPFIISFWRCLFASLFLFAILGRRAKKIPAALKSDWKRFLFISFTGAFIFNIFVFSSLRHTTATSSSILMNANPIFILVIASIFAGEKITPARLLGVILGFTGCIMVIMGTEGSPPAGNTLLKGNIMAVAGSLCWAVYTVAGKVPTQKYGSLLTTFLSFSFGTVFFFLLNSAKGFPVTAINPSAFIAGAYLGIIPAGIGFTIWYNALKYIEAGELGILQYLTPITTAVLAVTILKESFTILVISGMSIIFFSIYISDIAKKKTPTRVF